MSKPYVIPSVLRPDAADRAVLLLKRYADGRWPDGLPAWSGSQFESLGANERDRITADDLVAVSMLGVNFPAHASLWILGDEGGQQLAEQLRQIEDVDLWSDEGASLTARGGPMLELWHLVDAQRGVDMTLTSKLLARKRSRLIPVQDSVVRAAVGWRAGDDFWAGMRELLLRGDASLVDHLRALRSGAGLEDRFSILRTFDIAVWMAAHDTEIV